jgi:pimeloyl-ACP methyl ester carboxylesterase
MNTFNPRPAGEKFTVAGGVAGHAAMTEDLHAAVAALLAAAERIREASVHVGAAVSAVTDASFAMTVHPVGLSWRWAAARAEGSLETLLAGPTGTRRAEDTLLDIGERLRATVQAMEDAENAAHRAMTWRDHAVEGSKDWMGAVGYMPRWGMTALWAVLPPGRMMSAIGEDPVLRRLSPGVPDTTGLFNRDTLEAGPDLPPEVYRSLALSLAALARAPEIRFGEPYLIGMRATGPAPRLEAPRSTADIVRGIEATEALGGGAVTIQQIGAGEGVSYVVYIPGTSDATPWGTNPSDWQSNFVAASGLVSDSMRAVEQAMTSAGIPADAPVMLAGHSQGGIVAMALASAPAFAERFRVTHVVTTGAPVAGFNPPRTVQTLHFEHTEDVVPALDLKANGNGANQTTFSHSISQSKDPRLRQLGQELLSAHSLEGYAATAELAQSGVSTSVDAFVDSASDFFVPDAQSTSTAYAPVGDHRVTRTANTVTGWIRGG